MFFSSPLLGDLSDQIGRKKVMIISLVGAFIGYFLTVIAILVHSISLLLFSRLIAGITAGSIATAKAAMIDVSTAETKTTYIGYMLLAISLGCILGPLISGILSNSQLVSWFHLTTPFYLAAVLSFLNVVYLFFCFTERYKPTNKSIDIKAGLTAFISAFILPNLRMLSTAFLCMQFGWAAYIQFIPLFLALRFHFTASEIGVYLALTGIGFSLAFCHILTLLTKYFTLQHIALYSISLIVIFIFSIVASNNATIAWVLSLPSATCLAISYSVLISLFSGAVSEDKQGWVMGVTGAISAFAFGVSGLVAGVLVDVSASAPLWITIVLLIVSAMTVCCVKGK